MIAFDSDLSIGRRIAHGALLVGYMSTVSTISIAHVIHREGLSDFPVSAGYDRVRFRSEHRSAYRPWRAAGGIHVDGVDHQHRPCDPQGRPLGLSGIGRL